MSERIEMMPERPRAVTLILGPLEAMKTNAEIIALDLAELSRLTSRWVSELQPVVLQFDNGALLGLTVEGFEDLIPLPVPVRSSLEYQLMRGALLDQLEID